MDNTTDEVENVDTPVEQKAVLLVFSNHKDDKHHMGLMQGLLKMAYHTTLTNRLAVMQAKNSETGEEEVVLVGVDQSGDSLACYPLFVPLRAEDVGKYLAPDGQGGWINPSEEPTVQ